MSGSLLLQYALIALAVVVSVAVVLRKQFPSVERSLRGALALWLLGPQRGARWQRLGRWMAPAARSGGSCGGCGSCGPDIAKKP